MMSHWPVSFWVTSPFNELNQLGCIFCHVQFCTFNVHIHKYLCMGFVMHIFVRMTIRIHMGFRLAHFCTNDYPCSFLMGFRHAHFCTNDYPFLCVWVFVMHISVRMTIHIHMGFRHRHFCMNDYPYSFWMGFRHAHFCTNDYLFPISFQCVSVKRE